MTSSSNPKRVNFSLAVLQCAFFAMLFVTEGMFSQYLNNFGYDDSLIGVVLMSIGISSLVFQPLIGFICDKFLNYRAVFLFLYGLSALGLPFFFKYGEVKAVVFIYSIFVLGALKAMFSAFDSWIKKLQAEIPSINYGKLRSVGSVAYSVASIAVAQFISAFSVPSVSWLYIALFALMVVAVFCIPNPVKQTTAPKVSLRTASAAIFKNKNFLVFQVCAFLVWLTGMAPTLFCPRLVTDLGGDVSMIGIVNAVMAISEFVIIANFSKISAKIGLERLLIVGMGGLAIKNVLWGICPTPEWLIFASMSQMFSYAILIPAAVEYLDNEIPKAYIASAFVVYHALGTSLSQIVGSPIYGALSEKFGISNMLIICSIPGFIGTAIFAVHLMKRRKAA